MKIVYSEEHRHHDPEHEFRRSENVPAFERAVRASVIETTLREKNFGTFIAPDEGGVPFTGVHDEAYLRFLRTVHARFQTEGSGQEPLPYCWPTTSRPRLPPQDLFGAIGFFAGDADTPIVAGTWKAAEAAARGASTAARKVARGEARAAFALTRPPGHHASRSTYSGYCFLNNAALACAQLQQEGFARVALLDIDYHHGNGSQAIFEATSDVLFVSIHADPDHAYPFYSGRADEVGHGEGRGFTVNLPLPPGTTWDPYRDALLRACEAIARFAPSALVVSIGLDIAVGDPLGTFELETDAFREIGALLRTLHLPTVFVLEGGYDIPTIGLNTFALLNSFAPDAQDDSPGAP
ncbi:MAG: histone deacetylase family protein [Myxococcota bacterium]